MKKLSCGILFIIGFTLCLLPGNNTTLKFDRLSIEQGLSQNSISCILQDSKGFLWVGTEDGLNRYDGYTFKTYYHNPNNPNSLSHNRVRSLYEDKMGNLWVGTMSGGLNKFVREEEKFYCYTYDPNNSHSLSDNTILTIYGDDDGVLWIGTYAGLNRFEPESGRFTRFLLDNSGLSDPSFRLHTWVTDIFKDSNGRFWLGTSKGLVRFDPEKGEFINYLLGDNEPTSQKGRIMAICEDKKGIFWIGTYSGLRIFDPISGKPISLKYKSKEPLKIFQSRIETIFRDHSDILWIGTIDGLYKYDPVTTEFEYFRHHPDKSRSLSSDFVISIYEDRANVMWIGTYSGLSKFDNKKKKFSHYKISSNSYEDNVIFSIYEDKSGFLWLGTYRGGLKRFDRKTGTSVNYINLPHQSNSISSNNILAICEADSNSLWLGTENGLNRFDFMTEKFDHYIPNPNNSKSLSNQNVLSLFKDSSGTLWVGTADGLNCLDNNGKTFTIYRNDQENKHSISNNFISSLVEDSQGILWIGTYGGGLNRFNRMTGGFTSFRHEPDNPYSLSNDKIYPVLVDRLGNVWVGTFGGGLSKFNPKSGTFINYTRNQGLPNHVILGILEDKGGNLWLSTNSGLSKFNPSTGEFRNYVLDDGLQGYEFFQNSCFKSKNGEMFYGGSNGFNAFFPEKVKDNPLIPQVVFTSFIKFNREVILDKPICEVQELHLSHSDYYFSLKFAALDFTAPQRNLYAYKLEGFRDEWIQLENKRDITFTRLPPGKYVLKVKASNSDGVWNGEGASLKIIISSPFYYTWWFKIIAVVLVFGFLYWVLRIRTRNLSQKSEKERLKQELKLKADFTAMLVHDLRSPLTAVIGYSQLLSEASSSINVPKAGKVITDSSEKMLGLINDMLDLSKFEAGKMTLYRKPVEFTRIVDQIIEMLTPLVDRKGIHLIWEKDTGTEDMTFLIDPERLSQVVNNLLSNAIKFTPEKGNIIMRLSNPCKDNNLWEFAVTDDGPGVPVETRRYLFDKYAQLNSNVRVKGTGLGLAVSRMIIESHGGIIGHRPGKDGKGSTFYFRVPA